MPLDICHIRDRLLVVMMFNKGAGEGRLRLIPYSYLTLLPDLGNASVGNIPGFVIIRRMTPVGFLQEFFSCRQQITRQEF